MQKSIPNYILLLFVCLFASCKTTIQTERETIGNYDITIPMKQLLVDKLNYIYIISTRNELIRYDEEFKLQYSYSNERLGAISSVDISNPLKILVFYESFQTIVVLDNLLGEVERYNLFDLGFNNIKAVGSSNDNKVWLYDPISYKLKKIDSRGVTALESITMYNEKLEHIDPMRLEEQGNKVFLYDPQNGFIIFDNLGQFLNRTVVDNLETYDIINDNSLAYLSGSQIEIYDIKYQSIISLNKYRELETMKVLDFVVKKPYLFYTDGNGMNRIRL